MLAVLHHERNPKILALRIGGDNLLSLNAAELYALGSQLSLWLAMYRPGDQPSNAGITPRWYMDQVTTLAIVRDRLVAMKGGAA